MFDIGWTEMMVIACVAILVVGPKDLPKMLRSFGKTMSSLKRMAGDFQRQFDDALKEADLDEIKNIATPSSFKPLEDAKKSMQEFKQSVENPASTDAVKKPKNPVPSKKTVSKKSTSKTTRPKAVKSRVTRAKPTKTAKKPTPVKTRVKT